METKESIYTSKVKMPYKATGSLQDESGRNALEMIIRAAGHLPEQITTKDLGVIAERLSAAADGGKTKGRSWTRSYLRQILNGQIQPSVKFTKVANAVLGAAGSEPARFQGAVAMTVRVVGKVTPGAIILAESQPCQREDCPVEFVPVVPWQKFCCKECSQADYNERRRNERTK